MELIVSVASNIRAARAAAWLVAPQSAKGVIVDDWSTGAVRLWTGEEAITPGPELTRGGPYNLVRDAASMSGRFPLLRMPRGKIVAHLTPSAAEYLLRSNWGTFAGGAFTLLSQPAEWFTVALVEDAAGIGTSAQKLIRDRDCFFHRLTIDVDAKGYAKIAAEYCGTTDAVHALNTLAEVTLPAVLPSPDRSVFEGRGVSLVLDPAGAATPIPFDTLALTLDQHVAQSRWQIGNVDVYKADKTEVRLEIATTRGDELWSILEAARAGTVGRYLLSFSNPAGAALSFDFATLIFDADALERRGTAMLKNSVAAVATRDPNTGDYVSISLA